MPIDAFLAASLQNACGGAIGNIVSDSLEGAVKFFGDYIADVILGIKPDNSDLLKAAAMMVRAVKDDNELKVRQRQNDTKTTSNAYNQWHSRVPKIVQELDRLRAECEKERSLVLDSLIASKLSQKVRTILERVHEFLEEGKFREDFLADKPAEPVEKIDSVPDITKFHTLRSCLEKIEPWLIDEKVKTVVIWGLPGVGKTTIMQNLNNHEVVQKNFQMVIWITMSVENTVEKQQREIARRLKLDVKSPETSRGIARRILEKLKDMKYLLLLDNVSGLINRDWLSLIGVPDNQNGSKVVLTTQDRAVCFEMDSVMEVEVKRLTRPEAWVMFKQIVISDQNIKISAFEAVAQLVANECGGLPFVINKVASYLRCEKSDRFWWNALEELRKGSTADIPHLTQIHSVLKSCYEKLEGEKKICFLYGALHPPDTQIPSDYLVFCWAAERLLGNIDERRSLSKACDKGYAMLKYLTKASLLQADRSMEHVLVNKVVRQVALHIISSKDNEYKFLVGEPKQQDWKVAKRIFLMEAVLDCWSAEPGCSDLRALLLLKDCQLKAIPGLLFKEMKKLLVLNLSEAAIKYLPSQIGKLQSLRALFLNNCGRISKLPSQMENLRHLLVLDILGCRVDFIPPFIGRLDLRCLRVSYHKTGTENGCSNEISKLLKLEELVIDVGSASYLQWRDEATKVIVCVASLKNLTSLQMCFPKTEDLWIFLEKRREYGDCKQLSSFRFFIGCQNSRPQIFDYFSEAPKRYLGYNYDWRLIGTTNFKEFPETDAFELISQDNFPCLSEFMKASGLNGVSGCLVDRCCSMLTIIDGNKAGGADILPSLQQLYLRNLPVLESIFVGRLSPGSLSNLQTIVVERCHKLTEISSNDLIQQLPELTELTIQKCDALGVLIGGSGSMQNLEVLKLLDMENLTAICTDESLKWPKLKELWVYGCKKLERLPFNKEIAAGLKLIKGEEAWWNDLSNDEFKEHFQGILRLTV